MVRSEAQQFPISLTFIVDWLWRTDLQNHNAMLGGICLDNLCLVALRKEKIPWRDYQWVSKFTTRILWGGGKVKHLRQKKSHKLVSYIPSDAIGFQSISVLSFINYFSFPYLFFISAPQVSLMLKKTCVLFMMYLDLFPLPLKNLFQILVQSLSCSVFPLRHIACTFKKPHVKPWSGGWHVLNYLIVLYCIIFNNKINIFIKVNLHYLLHF